jgi:hypothetical protein
MVCVKRIAEMGAYVQVRPRVSARCRPAPASRLRALARSLSRTPRLRLSSLLQLLEYNNIEGMILLSELSRRRIRSINKLLRVGKNEVVRAPFAFAGWRCERPRRVACN